MSGERRAERRGAVEGDAAGAGWRDRVAAAMRSASWRRLGLIGFLFFLGKGLAWLLVPILLAAVW